MSRRLEFPVSRGWRHNKSPTPIPLNHFSWDILDDLAMVNNGLPYPDDDLIFFRLVFLLPTRT
jgi:hypothetical protein